MEPSTCLLRIFCVFGCVSLLFGQFSPRKEKFFARSVEVPYVICQVCHRGVRHLVHEVKQLKSKRGKADEDDILAVVEKFCNPDTKHGEWIERYDIVEENGNLKIVEFDDRAKCKEECRTIAKACDESIAEADTDVGELLWRNKLTTAQLINKVCNEMTSACSKKPGKFPSGKRKDEKFVPMSKDEKNANDVLKELKGVPGMPGMEMYSKEDIEKMQAGGNKEKAEEDAKNYQEKEHKSSNPGLLETFQAVGRDVVNWFRKLFGFRFKKSEL